MPFHSSALRRYFEHHFTGVAGFVRNADRLDERVARPARAPWCRWTGRTRDDRTPATWIHIAGFTTTATAAVARVSVPQVIVVGADPGPSGILACNERRVVVTRAPPAHSTRQSAHTGEIAHG